MGGNHIRSTSCVSSFISMHNGGRWQGNWPLLLGSCCEYRYVSQIRSSYYFLCGLALLSLNFQKTICFTIRNNACVTLFLYAQAEPSTSLAARFEGSTAAGNSQEAMPIQ